MKAWRERHKPEDPNSRCCWVCGKTGGNGFTAALILAGYRLNRNPNVGPVEVGHAHSKCIRKAQRETLKIIIP